MNSVLIRILYPIWFLSIDSLLWLCKEVLCILMKYRLSIDLYRVLRLVCLRKFYGWVRNSLVGSPNQLVTLVTLFVWIESSPCYPKDVGKLSNLVKFICFLFVFGFMPYLWLTRHLMHRSRVIGVFGLFGNPLGNTGFFVAMVPDSSGKDMPWKHIGPCFLTKIILDGSRFC